MSNLTDEQYQQFWKHGYPLSKAPLTFARKDNKEAYESAMSESAIEASERALEELAASGKTGFEAFKSYIAKPTAVLTKQSKVRADMRTDVISWGSNKVLRAFAYQAPRQLNHAPVELPISVWSGKILWDESRIEVGGMQFVEVRLLTNSMIKKVEAKYRSHLKPTGRPSIQEHLEACIEELVHQGSIDPSRSMRSQFDLIKERYKSYANAHKLEKDTVGNEAIRKILSPIINKMKE